MKKNILFFLNLIVSLSLTYSQTAREIESVKGKNTIKLPVVLNKDFGISASALNESFEGTEFPPAGWVQFTLDGGNGWSRESAGTTLPGWITDKVITTPPNGGNFVAYCTWSSNETFNDQWLITPLIQNIQLNDRIYFWLRKQLGYPDTVYIYYSLDGSNFNQMGHVSYPLNSDTNWGFWYSKIGDVVPAGSSAYVGFREYVEDNDANGATISLDLVYTVSYPANININNNFTFGDPAKSEGYRMVSLPGSSNRLANTGIPGEQRKDWNIFDDNGAETGTFLVEFSAIPAFNFTPGKGFWILSKNSFGINQNVNSVPLTDGYFEIPLHNGWNIIGNPFEKNISWSVVQNANGVIDPINLFNGAYSQPDIMEPYKGYYYYNRDNRSSLFLPYNYTQIIGKQNGGYDLKNSLKISLLIDNREKSAASVSFNNNSDNGCDKFDIFAPPGSFEEVKISIYNELLPSYKYLMTDSRSEIGEGQSYNIKVKNSSGKICFINIEGLEYLGNNEIYLFDLRLKKNYNLKLQNKIEISPLLESSDFQLLIGTESFINNMKTFQTPDEYMLYQNYPNPFNPSTLIIVDLPRNQNINLMIYNILGERVKSIFSGELEAGRHEFVWNGINDLNSDAASGVYIYSLEGPEIKLTKKMILNR